MVTTQTPVARTEQITIYYGGPAFVVRDSIKVYKLELDVNASTFKYLCSYVTSTDRHFMLFGIYRPGSQAVYDAFFDDLSVVLEQLAVYSCPVVVYGDFNIHVDLSDDKLAAQLLQLLQSFDMVQHVTEPTLIAAHTLDLVIATQDTTIDGVHVATPISDHSLVIFMLRAKKQAPAVQSVTSRAWRRLSMEDFASDLAASKLCTDLDALSNMSVDEMVRLYRTLDSHH